MAILKCNCIHPDQDSLHGKQFRVHNLTKGGKYRCTVCGNLRDGLGKQEITIIKDKIK